MTLGNIEDYAKKLKIKHFRGVFMRDTLPDKPKYKECGVLNLDSILNQGTHWTTYLKRGNQVFFFDSYGQARPPIELVKYLGVVNLRYNTDNIQTSEDPPICGHLCLEVLRLANNEKWEIICNIIKRDKYAFTSWL